MAKKAANPDKMANPLTFRILTLGCKVNQYESELLREQLLANGMIEPPNNDPADIYIVNTCTVTAKSDAKCRKIIRHISKENSEAKIYVSGCYAERDAEILRKIPNVKKVVNNTEKPNLAKMILGNTFQQTIMPFEISGFEEHTRAFIKIQDGCDEFCSYCIIPYVRGRSRSRGISEIADEAKRLVKNGYKEIVLTGIHVGAFGKTEARIHALPELISELAKITGLHRLRLSSIDPNEVNNSLISAIADTRVACKHLHISLQSGSTRILKAMRRKYSADEFLNLVKILYEKIPDISISTDIMVGFPGETEHDFELSCAVVQQAKFSKVHVFPFSPRPGTVAEKMTEQINPKVIRAREIRLIKVAERVAIMHKEKFLGRAMDVLVETKGENHEGFTDNYLRVCIDSQEPLDVNEIVKVKIQSNDSRFLYGVVV